MTTTTTDHVRIESDETMDIVNTGVANFKYHPSKEAFLLNNVNPSAKSRITTVDKALRMVLRQLIYQDASSFDRLQETVGLDRSAVERVLFGRKTDAGTHYGELGYFMIARIAYALNVDVSAIFDAAEALADEDLDAQFKEAWESGDSALIAQTMINNPAEFVDWFKNEFVKRSDIGPFKDVEEAIKKIAKENYPAIPDFKGIPYPWWKPTKQYDWTLDSNADAQLKSHNVDMT